MRLLSAALALAVLATACSGGGSKPSGAATPATVPTTTVEPTASPVSPASATAPAIGSPIGFELCSLTTDWLKPSPGAMANVFSTPRFTIAGDVRPTPVLWAMYLSHFYWIPDFRANSARIEPGAMSAANAESACVSSESHQTLSRYMPETVTSHRPRRLDAPQCPTFQTPVAWFCPTEQGIGGWQRELQADLAPGIAGIAGTAKGEWRDGIPVRSGDLDHRGSNVGMRDLDLDADAMGLVAPRFAIEPEQASLGGAEPRIGFPFREVGLGGLAGLHSLDESAQNPLDGGRLRH